MNKRATSGPSPATLRRVAGRLEREHPRSVPIVEEEGEPDRDADQPFEEGSHDAIDPDLRHRLISEAAFGMYQRRDFADGYDLDDWLQAEEQIDHMLLHPPTETIPGPK